MTTIVPQTHSPLPSPAVDPQEGDVVIAATGDPSRAFCLAAYRHDAQLLYPDRNHAMKAARSFAAKFGVNVWSANEGCSRFKLIGRYRASGHGTCCRSIWEADRD